MSSANGQLLGPGADRVAASPTPGIERGSTLRKIVRHRSFARIAVGAIVGVGLLSIFLRLVNVNSIAHQFDHLNLALAPLCGAAFLAAYAVRALRWRRFLTPDVVSARRATGTYFVATFLNWALPVQGGELAKSVILRRSNDIPINRSLATVTMDKTMDLLPAIVLIALVPLLPVRVSRPLWILLILALAVLVGGALLVALLSRRQRSTNAAISRLIGAVLPRRFSEGVEPFVSGFTEALVRLARRPRLLFLGACYTVVAVALDALFCYLAFLTIGVSLSALTILYGYTFYNLGYILPTPPAHLGSNELIGLLVFSGMLGVNRTAVAAMFLFSHPWTGILMTGSGLASLRALGLNLRGVLSLQHTARREEPE